VRNCPEVVDMGTRRGSLLMAAAGRTDGLRVCSMWTLYVESHVWGHDEVRTKHVMFRKVCTLGKDAQKTIRNPIHVRPHSIS
jgi:hypothetical protein